MHAQPADTLVAGQLGRKADELAADRQFVEAIELEKRALDIYLFTGPAQQEVEAYWKIGRYFRQLGDYDSCHAYLHLAVTTGEAELAFDHPTLLKSYNSLGIYHYVAGECEEALEYYRRALKAWLQKSGGRTLEVANLYNNMAICHDRLDQFDRSLDYYERALSIREERLGPDDPSVGESYFNLGTCYHYLGDYNRALDYYQQAREVWEKKLKPDSPDFASLYNNMGVCYQNKGDYRRAEELLTMVLERTIRLQGPRHPDVANAYNNLGLNYYEQGDFNKALVFFNNALAIRREKLGDRHPLSASLYNNIGNCYRMKKDYRQALSNCRLALEMRLERFGDQHREVADSYNDLGLYYEEVGDYEEALKYYHQALAINLDKLGPNHPAVADSYERIGRSQRLQGQLEASLWFFRKALAVRETVLGSEHPDVAGLYVQLARCFPGQPDQALDLCDQALQMLGLSVSEQGLAVARSTPFTPLDALQTKGEIELKQYLDTDRQEWLQRAAETYKLALRVIDEARKVYQEPASKQLLLDQYFRIFEKSLEVQYLYYQLTCEPAYLEAAFDISENSKNVLLMEAVQKSHAEHFAGLPDKLLQRENDLLIDLSFYEQQRFKAEQSSSTANAPALRDLRSHIFDLKQQYYLLLDTLREDFPDYFQLRYGRPVVSLATLRREVLPPGQTLLEYFVGDDFLYLFILSDDGAELMRTRLDFPLREWVRDLRRQLLQFHPLRSADPMNLQRYEQRSFQLYYHLLGPAEHLLTDSVLVVVPDGVLGYLPFECLLSRPMPVTDSWKAFPYLIRDYQISYRFAASFLPEDLGEQSGFQGELLAFAPQFTGGEDELKPLRYNVVEAQAIGRLLGGEVLLGGEATEARFRESAGKYRILHLATHAQANDTIGAYSYLAFSTLKDSLENELLYVRDLYNMRLPAEMVVLSACETGIGEWQRGEGIVSLGRGFLFAGARSIVTTLWSVDDQPSAWIMERFYRHLKEGQRKDAALREAKLEFLANNSDLRSHPLFWAGFIPVGEMEPIYGRGARASYGWWAAGISLGILLLAVFWTKGPFQKIR